MKLWPRALIFFFATSVSAHAESGKQCFDRIETARTELRRTNANLTYGAWFFGTHDAINELEPLLMLKHWDTHQFKLRPGVAVMYATLRSKILNPANSALLNLELCEAAAAAGAGLSGWVVSESRRELFRTSDQPQSILK